MPIRETKVASWTSAAYNGSVAARIIYAPGGTWTVTQDGTTLTLVGGGTTTALTIASYATYGALEAAVEAVSGWTFNRVGAPYNKTLTATHLNTFTVTSGTEAGIELTFDATDSLIMTVAVGANEDPDIATGIAMTNAAVLPYTLDTTLTARSGQRYKVAQRSILRAFYAVSTYGGGTETINVYKTAKASGATRDADNTPVFSIAAGLTTVPKNVGSTELGAHGLETGDGEWLIIESKNSGTAKSAGTIGLVDAAYGEAD
jgi:hypothetical protein